MLEDFQRPEFDHQKPEEKYPGWQYSMAAGVAYAVKLSGEEALVIYGNYDAPVAGSPRAQGLLNAVRDSFEHSIESFASTLNQTIIALEKTGNYEVDRYEREESARRHRPISKRTKMTILTPAKLVARIGG